MDMVYHVLVDRRYVVDLMMGKSRRRREDWRATPEAEIDEVDTQEVQTRSVTHNCDSRTVRGLLEGGGHSAVALLYLTIAASRY